MVIIKSSVESENSQVSSCFCDNRRKMFYNYVFYGDGDTVIYQSPDQGEKIKEGDSIMLYMG